MPKGYILETDSLVNGINKLGYKYQYYRLIKTVPNKVLTVRGRDSEQKRKIKRRVKKRKNPNRQKTAGNKKNIRRTNRTDGKDP